MKATELYFHYAIQDSCKFDFVYDILECNHSHESYWAVFSCGAVYYALQVLTFNSVYEIRKCNHWNES